MKTKFINNFFGYGLLLPISTFFYAGMIPWIFKIRGKGGGLTTGIVTSIVLISLYKQNLNYIDILSALAFVIAMGVLFIGGAERFMLFKWGERKRHNGDTVRCDFNETTIDEVAGVLLAVLPIYIMEAAFKIKIDFHYFVLLQLIAMFAFRRFDVKKPGLIGWVEANMNKESSITIMADDIMAALYTMPITITACVVLSPLILKIHIF